MRRLANREESRHRAQSVLKRQFGQEAVGVTRQSLAEDLLFALDELDERAGLQWHVFDKDDESLLPPDRTPCWVAFPSANGSYFMDVRWSQLTEDWIGASHWMEITIPSPPLEEEK